MEERFETFTLKIAQISRSIRRIKTEEMASFGLKSPHVSCLYYLYKEGGALTAKELCDRCDEDKAAISRSLLYLETEGYILSDSKTAKRYKCPLTLSEKGKRVGEGIAEKIDGILFRAGEGMTDGEREIFYKCLGMIADNLQEISDGYGD